MSNGRSFQLSRKKILKIKNRHHSLLLNSQDLLWQETSFPIRVSFSFPASLWVPFTSILLPGAALTSCIFSHPRLALLRTPCLFSCSSRMVKITVTLLCTEIFVSSWSQALPPIWAPSLFSSWPLNQPITVFPTDNAGNPPKTTSALLDQSAQSEVYFGTSKLL